MFHVRFFYPVYTDKKKIGWMDGRTDEINTQGDWNAAGDKVKKNKAYNCSFGRKEKKQPVHYQRNGKRERRPNAHTHGCAVCRAPFGVLASRRRTISRSIRVRVRRSSIIKISRMMSRRAWTRQERMVLSSSSSSSIRGVMMMMMVMMRIVVAVLRRKRVAARERRRRRKRSHFRGHVMP